MLLAHHVGQRGNVLNREIADRLADFRRIRIEGQRNAEAAIAEAAIANQRLPHIAHADQRHRPFAIDFEDAAELILQVADPIARALLAEFAKVR